MSKIGSICLLIVLITLMSCAKSNYTYGVYEVSCSADYETWLTNMYVVDKGHELDSKNLLVSETLYYLLENEDSLPKSDLTRIDPRIVIKAFDKNEDTTYISIDNIGNFQLENQVYLPNENLNQFLCKNGLLKDCISFRKECR